jgi:hypothetical protein
MASPTAERHMLLDFQTSEYCTWKCSTVSSTLWLSGSIETGKTVALANITANICVQSLCFYFFCMEREAVSLTARNIIGSIAHQIPRDLPIENPFWDEFEQATIKT